jgi:hypothetical protein
MRASLRALYTLLTVTCIASPATAHAAGWAEVLKAVTGSEDVIGKLAKSIHDAVNEGVKTVDEFQLRAIRSSLDRIRSTMVTLNAKKRENIDALSDYLNHATWALPWSSIQEKWGEIGKLLSELIDDIDANNSSVVRATGFNNSTDLRAALDNQKAIYTKLSETPEPKSEDDLENAKKVNNKLLSLFTTVQNLENEIDTYLRKFDTAPGTPPR